MKNFPQSNPLVLFDGVCNFCEWTVQFIYRHDQKGIYHFCALQSPAGQRLLKDLDLPTSDFKTLVLLENGKIYTQSTAVLRISRHFSGLMKLLYVFLIVPKFIRNYVYEFISNNRYRWFGQKDVCMTPTPELKNRFLQ